MHHQDGPWITGHKDLHWIHLKSMLLSFLFECWPDTENLLRSYWDRTSRWAGNCAVELSKYFFFKKKCHLGAHWLAQSISNLSRFNYHFSLLFLLPILVHEPELFSLKHSSFPFLFSQGHLCQSTVFRMPMVCSCVTALQKVSMLSVSEEK